jgi:hypothetical protein
MKTLLTINKLLLACLVSMLSSCSTLSLDTDKISEALTWGGDKNNSLPKNAVAFECAKSQAFFIQYLDEKNAVWVVLKNREFRLNKSPDQTNTFTNGDTLLEINPDNTILKIQEQVLYDLCKEKKSLEG